MLFLDLVSLGGYSGSPVILEATGHMLLPLKRSVIFKFFSGG